MINETARTTRSRWVTLFAVLLLAATAMFVLGIAVERNQGHRETAGSSESPTREPSEHVEGQEGHEPAEHVEAGEAAEQEAGNESVFGVDPESTSAVTAVVLVSLLLAGVVWLRPAVWALLVGGLFCLIAAGFDVREAIHQINENRAGVAFIAVVVALLHGAAAVSAAVAVAERRRQTADVTTG